ncbi:hypothetical protein FH5_02175 [Priestia endophytica]|nr:hypothetical protein FH5_02175 [Priestia endophytica]
MATNIDTYNFFKKKSKLVAAERVCSFLLPVTYFMLTKNV